MCTSIPFSLAHLATSVYSYTTDSSHTLDSRRFDHSVSRGSKSLCLLDGSSYSFFVTGLAMHALNGSPVFIFVRCLFAFCIVGISGASACALAAWLCFVSFRSMCISRLLRSMEYPRAIISRSSSKICCIRLVDSYSSSMSSSTSFAMWALRTSSSPVYSCCKVLCCGRVKRR